MLRNERHFFRTYPAHFADFGRCSWSDSYGPSELGWLHFDWLYFDSSGWANRYAKPTSVTEARIRYLGDALRDLQNDLLGLRPEADSRFRASR